MAPQYKLTYFNAKALGEPIRFILKYGGIEFEDDRFEHEEWPAIKETFPYGQTPVLVINGKVYNQSISIARYFAKKVKLVGNDELEDLEIDAVVDTINDMRLRVALYYYEKDEAIKQSRKEPLLKEIIPYFFQRFEKVAKENGGHLACKKLTWADLYFAALIDYLNVLTGLDLTSKYPNLETVRKNVFAIPAIKEWVNKRPKTEY